jgi:hypothetical protein
LYSGRYGTFLMNCEKDRFTSKLRYLTSSVWDMTFYALSDGHSCEWSNPLYSVDEHQKSCDCNSGMLTPDITTLRFWATYYLRFTRLHRDIGQAGLAVEREKILDLPRDLKLVQGCFDDGLEGADELYAVTSEACETENDPVSYTIHPLMPLSQDRGDEKSSFALPAGVDLRRRRPASRQDEDAQQRTPSHGLHTTALLLQKQNVDLQRELAAAHEQLAAVSARETEGVVRSVLQSIIDQALWATEQKRMQYLMEQIVVMRMQVQEHQAHSRTPTDCPSLPPQPQ